MWKLAASALAFVLFLAVGLATPTESRAASYRFTVEAAPLLGLSQDELRARLRLRPLQRAYVHAVSLEDGVETRTISAQDLTAEGGACGSHSRADILTTDRGLKDGTSHFFFREDRLVAIRTGAGDRTLSAEATLSVQCYLWKEDHPVSVVGHAVIYSPFILAAGLGASPRIVRRTADLDALAALRLGEEPPGGLAAYRVVPPDAVTVGDAPDGSVVLTVSLTHLSRKRKPDVVEVTLREGRVVAISKGERNLRRCDLTAEGSMRCALLT